MKNSNDSFLQTRLKSIRYAFYGIWVLLTTEDSIKVQITVALITIILGVYFSISGIEWMIQLLTIGLVLTAEALNTAIEKIADFIHPAYNKKIGLIKDIAAGAPAIATIISLCIAGIIYLPKIAMLFR